MASISISGLAYVTPIFDSELASSMTLVMCKSAFEGIHPLFKQTPPIFSSLSTSITFLPKSAALNAAA